MKLNMLGLLSVSSAHAHFGPARNHWEGGIMGERKIQTAKPELHGRRGDYTDWTAIGLRKITLKENLQRLISDKESDQQLSKKTFKVYKNIDCFVKEIENHKAVSLVRKEDRIWTVLKHKVKN